MALLTCLRCLGLTSSSNGKEVVSLVGIDPLCKFLICFEFEPSSTIPLICLKQEGSKCTEHTTEDPDGVKYGLCLRTKLTHAFLVTGSTGN